MRRLTRGQIWAALGILAGVIFAIEGIADASGAVFAVTAIVIGGVYALYAVLFSRGGA